MGARRSQAVLSTNREARNMEQRRLRLPELREQLVTRGKG